MPGLQNNPPTLLIEAASAHNQALCVESIRCPEPMVTTPIPIPTRIPNPNVYGGGYDTQQIPMQGPSATASATAPSSQELIQSVSTTARKPANFWEAVMENSSPRMWVIATVVLAVLCFLLAIALICTCVWVCHVKKQAREKRCRGTCRFGCKCSPETRRQVLTEAAVTGPLLPNGAALANGSLLGFQSMQRAWGMDMNSAQNTGTPIYLPIGINEKPPWGPISATPPQAMSYQGSTAGSGRNWPYHVPNPQKNGKIQQDSTGSGDSSPSAHTPLSGIMMLPRSSAAGMGAMSHNQSTSNTSTCMATFNQADSENMLSLNGPGIMLTTGSPNQQEMVASVLQDGTVQSFNHDVMLPQPSGELRGLNGNVFQSGMEGGGGYQQSHESANITPPAAFFDSNGMQNQNMNSNNLSNQPRYSRSTPPKSSEQTWPSGTDNTNASYGTPMNSRQVYQAHPHIGVKVLPTGGLFGAKQNVSSTEFKRRNGFLNEAVTEEIAGRRPVGLSSRLVSYPLREGVELNCGFEEGGDAPLGVLANGI